MRKQTIYKSDSGKSALIGFYENLLKDYKDSINQILVPTSYGNTFVLSSGSKNAEVIVLLHGSSSNSSMWLSDMLEYSKKYRVYAIDIIGECGKSSEARPPFKESNYSNWINEVFNQLKIQNAVIIACSLGGWLATDYTLNYPKKVNKLVLIATAGITPVKLSALFWIILTSVFRDWGFQKLNKLVYHNLKIDKKAVDYAMLVKTHYKPRTDVLPTFSNDELQKINIPVLFIGGEYDCFYSSVKTAERIRQNIKHSKTTVITDTGHVVINVSNRIVDFIKSYS